MSAGSQSLSGWGRFPVAECNVLRPATPASIADLLGQSADIVARGNGRSYGDASLNPAATLDTRQLDYLVDFDPDAGTLVCQSGILLSEIVDVMLPRGWFPPVTPGTKFVTVGGMIASDVHGKNHHSAGSFCDHVQWIDLAVGEGTTLRCSPTDNAELFAATCGGMGLTGVILRACIRMLRVETAAIRQQTVRAATLAEAMSHFEAALDWTYSVAWIDCLAGGKNLGRSVVFLGEHAKPDELPQSWRQAPLDWSSRRPKRVPFDFPAVAMSEIPIRIFNRLYYAAQRPGDAIVDFDRYFYPLDAIHDWNRIYGRRGFVQFQCVLPLAESEAGLQRILGVLSRAGSGSFLAVLKRLGKQSFGMLSFPLEGYTLALDFPASPANLDLVERLGAITTEHGGRIYLAKDACATPENFAAGYPRLERFRKVRSDYGLQHQFSSLLSRRLEI